MKLLLADSHHSLGVALEHELEREPFNLLQPPSNELDWSDRDAVAEYIARQRPNIVLNNLGWGDSPASANIALLPQAAENIASACAEQQIPVLQLSSYRVFGDDNKSKHSEKDEPTPNSDLGRAFYLAEQKVLEADARALVLRASWIVGSYGDNLLTRLLSALQENQPWRLNARLRGAPTALSDLARVTVAIIKQINSGAECWGVYHYCSGDACSEVEFAEQLWEVLCQQDYKGPEPVWERIDEPAVEVPVSAVLSGLRVRNDFGVQTRTWRTYLLPMVRQWLHTQQG
ncbi:sugar nucleotide-binding protein [Gilvimarinus sp. DA14]|uniref:SDR family oxidoreductase n=1 Tax=Gilvimarinus sp. DA14 TaxID=2956798 RepID=UPI0020B64429|nr:sugar nucleotide-binding protein [Gilvimarinus sp. DA14]UTF59582.1 NAD(P)-dependent oxidoreductase [Gilvimarinus sp. DA14]